MESMGTGALGSRVSHVAADTAATLQAQLGAAADAAADKLDSAREPLTDTLRGAADTLESSAGYIKSHSAQQMMGDVLTAVKKHPAQSLLIAGVLGFLVAHALRRD